MYREMVNMKFLPVHAMKAYGLAEVRLYLLLTSVLDGVVRGRIEFLKMLLGKSKKL